MGEIEQIRRKGENSEVIGVSVYMGRLEAYRDRFRDEKGYFGCYGG